MNQVQSGYDTRELILERAPTPKVRSVHRLDLSNDAQAAQRLAHTLAYQIAMTVAHERAATRLVSMSHG
jgi:hypothetical protein